MSENKNVIKHYWLYVLKLEQGKYYVGVTSKTPEKRMREHQSEFLTAAWTKEYKPIEIFDRKDLGDITYAQAEKFENKVVRKYMSKYGYNNVRGGDLHHNEKYIRRFGWYLSKEDWGVFTAVVLLVLIIVVLAIKIYFPELF